MNRALLVLGLALAGCSSLRYDLETTTLLPAPAAREVPSREALGACLSDRFSRRISTELIDRLHEGMTRDGSAWFQVRHDDHFHQFVTLFHPGSKVLVVAELDLRGDCLTLDGWRVTDVVDVPGPPANSTRRGPHPAPELAPCPACARSTVAPGDRFCTSCKAALPPR